MFHRWSICQVHLAAIYKGRGDLVGGTEEGSSGSKFPALPSALRGYHRKMASVNQEKDTRGAGTLIWDSSFQNCSTFMDYSLRLTVIGKCLHE